MYGIPTNTGLLMVSGLLARAAVANVLGKAVEYIQKWKARLKAEQVGPKALISRLVDGPVWSENGKRQ